MDDVDTDIERSSVGRRREEAYEIINHHPVKSTTTNLPPIKAVNKGTPHICDTCFFNDGEFIEQGVTKVSCKRIKFLIKKHKDEFCTFWNRK